MVTTAYVNTALSDSASDPLLYLLTISHADLPTPIRLVRNTVDVVSRGNTYTAFPFNITLPGDGEGGQRPARIQIDNIDQRIVQTVRAIATPPTLLIEEVKGSALDTVEQSLPPMKLYAATYDRTVLEADLIDSADDESEALVQWEMTPSLAPALFT